MSEDWNWIEKIISKEILNQDKLEFIKIKGDHILMKTSKDKEERKEGVIVKINSRNGKIYLENKIYNKCINIPIEDKVWINNINIDSLKWDDKTWEKNLQGSTLKRIKPWMWKRNIQATLKN